ncbi:Tetraspanin family protein [Entamoeba marina]
MTNTTLLITSIFGIVLSCFFPIRFNTGLLDEDIEFTDKISLLFISVGCVFSIIFFLSTTIIAFNVKKSGKICGVIGGILILVIGGFFIAFSIVLIGLNSFEENSQELHNIELKTNCCGWKELNLENCSAQNITNSIQTCFDSMGRNIENMFYNMLWFYISYTVYVIIVLFLLIRSAYDGVKKIEHTSTELNENSDDKEQEKPKNE